MTDRENRDIDPWQTHLPDLLCLLDGLAQQAVADCDAYSIGFLTHLRVIERQVSKANASAHAFKTELDAIGRHAETQETERRRLDRDLREAMTLGREVRDEFIASRQTLGVISAAIGQMQDDMRMVGHISREIDALAVKAADDPTVTPASGTGGETMAARLRHLASTTQAIADRLGPLIEQAHDSLRACGMEPGTTAAANPSLVAQMIGQDALLDKVSDQLGRLTADYADLVRTKKNRNRLARETGAELETAIRTAIASAQTGDIIRQQIELIIDVLRQTGRIAESQASRAETCAHLARVFADISKSFVMETQHAVHQSLPVKAARGSAVAPRDDLPRFEIF